VQARIDKTSVHELALIAEKLEVIKRSKDGHGSVLVRVDKRKVCHISHTIGEEYKPVKEE